MTESVRPEPRQLAWLMTGGVILAVIAALNDTFGEMYQLWIGIDQFNHCLLIAPASIWMIWRRRDALARIEPQISPAGLMAFVFVSALWAIGVLGRTAFVQHFAAVALIPLSVWALLGTQIVRCILFPLAYLFFLVPFGGALIPVLMDFTADMTVVALRWSGVPVYHDGLFLAIPNGSFRIIEACSGIRMLFAGLAVGALFAYLNFRSLWRRIVFLACVVVLTLIANWIRAYVVVLVAHLSGMDMVADHVWLGYVIFSIVVVIMLWGGSRFSDLQADRPDTMTGQIVSAGKPASLGATLSVAVLLVGIVALVPVMAAAGVERAGQTVSEPVFELPQADQDTGWNGPQIYDEAWYPEFIGDTMSAAGRYRAPSGTVDLIVISYRSLSAESELINETNRLFDPNRWVLIGQQPGVTANAAGEPIAYLQTRLRSSSGGYLVFRHWYLVDGHPRRSPVMIKLVELVNALLGRPTHEGAVFVSTRTGEDMTGTDDLLDQFMTAMIR